ncbi:Multidrug resistance protein MdtA [subsurface metagenome]
MAVTRAGTGNITESLLLHGSVQALKEVSIFSTVPGIVKNIIVSEGDRVRKNQVLAYIERDEAGLKFADAAIESTINGIVKEVHAEQGASITPTLPLFHIVDMNSVEVVAYVPEKDIPRVKTGMTAEVRVISYPDNKFKGRIYRLSPVVDPASRTREARILVPNWDHTLKPGMFGNTEIIIRSLNDAVLIPYSAIIDRQERQVVYKVEEGKAVEITAEIEIVQGERAAIKSGIASGDMVIVIGQHNLRDGDPVTVTEEIE